MGERLAEFEIFCDFGEGLEPRYITSVTGLENAKTMMKQFATEMPGRYFVWDSSEGAVMARIDSHFAAGTSPLLRSEN